MLSLLGEHHCKVDPKGRVMFPSKLRKQLEEVLAQGLVINRDIFSKSLILYPQPGWEKVLAEMSKLSRYDEEHQLFMEKFMNGASLIELDETGRMLIPSALMHYAGIDLKSGNEIVVIGLLDKMKIWSKANYEKYILQDEKGVDMRLLAKKIGKDIEGGGKFSMN